MPQKADSIAVASNDPAAERHDRGRPAAALMASDGAPENFQAMESAELQVVAAGVLAGKPDVAIAESLGLSVRTLYRRKALEETQHLITEARLDAARQIREGVVEGALLGLRRLHQIVGDPDSSDTAAVTASKYLVDLAIGPGGLPGLTEPVTPGATCGTCGHHHIADEDRTAAMDALREHLDGVKARLTAPVPGPTPQIVTAGAEQESRPGG